MFCESLGEAGVLFAPACLTPVNHSSRKRKLKTIISLLCKFTRIVHKLQLVSHLSHQKPSSACRYFMSKLILCLARSQSAAIRMACSTALKRQHLHVWGKVAQSFLSPTKHLVNFTLLAYEHSQISNEEINISVLDGFYLTCEDFWGRSFISHLCFFVYFKVGINSHTPIPLFRPGSVDSGSAS